MIDTDLENDSQELDIVKFFELLFRKKYFLISLAFLFFAIAAAYAFYLPNIYRAKSAIYYAGESDQSLSSKLGGIGLLSGGGLNPSSVSGQDIAIETLQSRKFILDFIKRNNIEPLLFAFDHWDEAQNIAVLDETIYDPSKKIWIKYNGGTPLDSDIYDLFMANLSIIKEISGIIKISFDFPVPDLAAKWLHLMISDLNELERSRAINENEARIEYLYQQLENTDISEVRNLLFGLIKENTQEMLTARFGKNFSFQILDPVVTPDIKESPSRGVIIVVGGLIGGLLGIVLILIMEFASGLKVRNRDEV